MPSMHARDLRRTGWAIAGLGLFMAVMAFVGPLVGIQFDSAPAWSLNADRIVLHVIPGVLGMLLGGLLVYAAGRQSEGPAPATEPEHIGTLRWLASGAIVIGVWQGGGPWLTELVTGKSGALMFNGVPNFSTFSPAHQLALEAVCHWLPGLFTVICGVACLGVLRAQNAGGPSIISGGSVAR